MIKGTDGKPPMKADFNNPAYVRKVLRKYGRKPTGDAAVDRINAMNLMRYSEADAVTHADPYDYNDGYTGNSSDI